MRVSNKLRSKTYNTVGTVPNSNRKIVERGKIDTLNTHKHDHTDNLVKSGGAKLAVWT